MPGDDRTRLEASGPAPGQVVTSPDGLVKATIDGDGSLAALAFAPHTFERTDPVALADTVLNLVRRGGSQAKQRLPALSHPGPIEDPDVGSIPSAPAGAPPMPAPKPASQRRAKHSEDRTRAAFRQGH